MTGSVWDTTGNVNVYLLFFDVFLDTTRFSEIDLGLNETAFQCKQTLDSGYIIVGNQESSGNCDVLLIKTDSVGSLEWFQTYGGIGAELGFSVDITSDKGYIIGAYTNSMGNGDYDSYVLKVDSLGSVQWEKTFGTSEFEGSTYVKELSDSNFIVATAIEKYQIGSYAQHKIRLLKLDTAGYVIWDREFGTARYGAGCADVIELESGDLIVAGQTTDPTGSSPIGNGFPEGVILKVNSDGDSLWWRKVEYFSTENAQNYLRAITPTSDGGFVGAGFIMPGTGDTGTQDMWVFKLDSCGCLESLCDSVCAGVTGINNLKLEKGDFKIYPNPATNGFNIQLSSIESNTSIVLYNQLGIKTKEVTTTEEITIVDVSNLSTGIYFVQVTNGVSVIGSRKIVIQR